MSPGLLTNIRTRRLLLRIAGNSAWLFGERALRGMVGIIVGAVVARYLGPNSFGTLSIVFAYVVLFASAAGLGLDGVVIRDLVKDPPLRPHILGTAFLLKSGCAIAVFLLGNTLVRVLDSSPYGLPLLVVIGSCALFFYAADIIDFLFQSELRGREIFVVRSSALAFSAVAKLTFVAVGAPLAFFAASPALDAAVAAAALFLIYQRTGGSTRQWRFEPARAAQLIKTALPIAASGFFVIGIMQVDKLMLDAIIGAHAVGIYSAASLLSAAWYAVPVVIGASAAPVLTGLHESDRVGYARRLQDVFSAVTLAGLCACTLVSLLSGPLIRLIFGDAYAGAALILAIHMWAGVFIASVSIRSRALLIEGKMKLILLFSGLTLLTNVLLNIVLIPRYAEVGAAIATLLSWGLSALLFPLVSRQSREFVAMVLQSFIPVFWARALAGR